MNEARFGPGEYQARPHYLPPFFLSTLAVILLAFGAHDRFAVEYSRSYQRPRVPELKPAPPVRLGLVRCVQLPHVTAMVRDPMSCVPRRTRETHDAIL